MPWNNTIIIFSIWWANLAIMLDYWIFPISIYYLSNHDKQIHLDNFCLPKILPGCNLKWKYDHCEISLSRQIFSLYIKTGNNLSTFPDLWLTSSLVVGLKEKKKVPLSLSELLIFIKDGYILLSLWQDSCFSQNTKWTI